MSLPSDTTINCPSSAHLLYTIPFALLLVALRWFLERCCFIPIGLSLGIRNGRRKAPQNVTLEKSYSLHKTLSREEILGLAKQLDSSEREVERWLRVRKNQDKPSTLDKFCESSWRLCYYLSFFILGVFVLRNKPWLWDTTECWLRHHSLDDGTWWYVIISLSFYVSWLVTQFFDTKRNDFWQMMAHHIITVSLLSLAWVDCQQRIISLGLIFHEFADIYLDAAKILKYTGYQKLCDGAFITFTAAWIVTRLGICPFWLVRSFVQDAPKFLEMTSTYYYITGMLLLLLALDVFWTYLILKTAFQFLKVGHAVRDARSSTSDDSDVSK